MGEAAGTVMRMTTNDINEMYRVHVAIFGRTFPTQLNRKAKKLMTS